MFVNVAWKRDGEPSIVRAGCQGAARERIGNREHTLPDPIRHLPANGHSAPGNRSAANPAWNVPPCATWTTMY